MKIQLITDDVVIHPTILLKFTASLELKILNQNDFLKLSI